MTFSSSVRRQHSMMTLRCLSPQAFFTSLISSSVSSYLPLLSQPTLMTMSTSSAPSSTAVFASKALLLVSMAPSGKPTTTQTFTSVSFRASTHFLVQQVLTQTEAKSCSFASSRSFSIFFSSASCARTVWSINLLIFISFLSKRRLTQVMGFCNFPIPFSRIFQNKGLGYMIYPCYYSSFPVSSITQCSSLLS